MRKSILGAFALLVAATAAVTSLRAHAELRPPQPGLTGQALEEKQDQMQSGYVGETREMTLTLISVQGAESVRKVRFEGQEGVGRHDKSRLSFTYPADMDGAMLLTHEQAERDDDQWLYLPAVKRIKRIATANQSGSFMGSEFAYEDLVVRQLDKYEFRYIGDETIDGKDCYVIERTPKNRSSGYSRIVRWRMKDNLQELRSDYYDRKGELLKRRDMTGHRLVEGYWRVRSILVTNVQTGRKSRLSFDDVKLKVNLPAERFSVQEFNAAQ
jgi:outer membrane lipoprotein-sorting protein